MHLKTLEDLFQDELFDIYDAEQRLTKALPKMADKASNPQLAKGFEDHLEETEGHVRRLEKVFESLGIKPKKEKCEAMTGLIAEAEELIKHTSEGSVRDAAMITAAQKVEHYEIATYGSLIALADALGHAEASAILAETLDEEKSADRKLSEIAESGVNSDALQEAA